MAAHDSQIRSVSIELLYCSVVLADVSELCEPHEVEKLRAEVIIVMQEHENVD